MKMIIFLLALLIAPFIVFAQQNVNYDDVAIIVNDNSQVSIDIGTYFQEQRNIPTQNVIYITASVQEEIDSTEFEQIRQQIEVYLTTNNLTNTINYLVTTKGVPLKVKRGEIDPTNTSSYLNCASLDSELSLILGDLSPRIANPGGIKNPYYNADNNFSRDIYGIYLVTRLDGYSKDDVLNLIDRSGPNIPVDKSTAQFILDIGDVGSHFDLVDSNLHEVADFLTSNKFTTIYHTESSLFTNQQNVLFYHGADFNPSNKVLNNTWLKGSAVELVMSFSASTFNLSNNIDNDLIIANLIAEGATGAHGYAYLSYYGVSLHNKIFLENYTGTSISYNLAESYYKAIYFLSDKSITIGDPKTSIIIDTNTSAQIEDAAPDVKLYPNPSQGIVFIEPSEDVVNSVKIFNAMGQLIQVEPTAINNTLFSINLSNQSAGIYFINLDTDKGSFNKKVLISK